MYAKVFRALWDGSLCGQSDAQLVFIYLLAHADADGYVCQPRAAIAAKTGLGIGAVVGAIGALESEDAASGSEDEGGRRLRRTKSERDEWFIVNHGKYRGMRDENERRRQNLEAQKRRRQLLSAAVSRGQPSSAHTEADTDTEADIESKDLLIGDEREGGVSFSNGEDRANPKGEWEEAFHESFWPDYPRKVAKKEALRAWMALKPWTQENLDDIYRGLGRWNEYWKEHDTESEHVPYPATWIHGDRHKEPPE